MGYVNLQVKNPERKAITGRKYENYSENSANNDGEYLFHVYTLGKFEVYSKGEILTEDNKRSIRMWNLFKYIFTHRKKMLSPGELIDVLWEEDSCENPEKALQNLIYRLRQSLTAAIAADDLILFMQGCYKWNEKIPVWIDCDAMIEYSVKGKELLSASPHEARNCFEKVIELYNGDYFSEIMYDMWVVPSRTTYRKVYVDCVMLLLELLDDLKDSEAIIRVCNHFFNYEYLDERVNIYFLNALISLNKKQEAQKHYNRTVDLMYKELGIRPSFEFTEIQKKIQAVKPHNDIKNINLQFINDILWKDERLPGAFQCDKETFISISKIMLRNLERSGFSVMMVLATVLINPNNSGNLNGTDMVNLLSEVEKVREKFVKSFRRGDIVCRWNPQQILIMLTNLTFEDAKIAMARINAKIKNEILKGKYDIEYTIVPLEHEII
ncbi:MAG: winged helix-turn-helix domain-containing protein [Oscillospiraceae bacterium]|nr:winged helix-turn-helix domain-containing protein [Oscillospiraceae bacterium]